MNGLKVTELTIALGNVSANMYETMLVIREKSPWSLRRNSAPKVSSTRGCARLRCAPCAVQIPITVFIQTVLFSAFVSRSDIGFKLGMVTKW